MIPKHIIEKAIAGGWKKKLMSRPNAYFVYDKLTREQGATIGFWFFWTELDMNKVALKRSIEILSFEISLDPDFWMALGKEMGWEKICSGCGITPCLTIYPHDFSPDTYRAIKCARNFYDLILRKASQEEIDNFWKSL